MRRLLFNMLVSGVGMFLAGAISLLVLPYVFSSYGAFEFGLFMTARLLMPSGIFNMLDFGIGGAMPRFVAGGRKTSGYAKQAQTLVTLANTVLAVLGLLVALLLLLERDRVGFFFNVGPDDSDAFDICLAAAAFTLPFGLPGLVFRGVLEGLQKQLPLRGIEVAVALAQSVAIFACVRAGLPFWSCVFVSAAAEVVRTIGFATALRLGGFRLFYLHRRWYPAWRRLTAVWQQFGLMKIYSSGAEQVARLMIGRLLGPEALGIWELVWRLPAFIKTAVSAANVAIYPYFLQMAAKNRRRTVRRSLTVGQDLYFLAAAPVHAALVVAADPFARLWMGSDVDTLGSAITLAFVVNMLTLFVYVPSMIGTVELKMLPKLARANLLQALSYLMALPGGLLLWGVTGGIVARVLSFLVYMLAQNSMFGRTIGFKLWSSLWPGIRTLAAALTAGAVFHILIFELFPLSLPWFLVYFCGLFLVSSVAAALCLRRATRCFVGLVLMRNVAAWRRRQLHIIQSS